MAVSKRSNPVLALIGPSQNAAVSLVGAWNMEARLQGRPRRGDAEVGRHKIISQLQRALRPATAIDTSRKNIAGLVGVTPALISYYFTDVEQLLKETVTPVLSGYRDEVEQIIGLCIPREEKLRKLIALLLHLYTHDRNFIDIYIAQTKQLDSRENEVSRIAASMLELVRNCCNKKSVEDSHAILLQGAIWGMCESVARISTGQSNLNDLVSSISNSALPLLDSDDTL